MTNTRPIYQVSNYIVKSTVFNLIQFIIILFGFGAMSVFAQNQSRCIDTPDSNIPFFDPCQTLLDLKTLSADKMQGRAPATLGQQRASQYIIEQFNTIGLQSLSKLGLVSTDGYKQAFSFEQKGASTKGENIVGFQRGQKYPNQALVITAHYDHLGLKGKRIMNGADDNASGVAGLLAIARFFSVLAPNYSIIYLATDAEEDGLHGAKYFLESWNDFQRDQSSQSKPLQSSVEIKANINLDMIGGKKGVLYFAGTRKNPAFKAVFDTMAERLEDKHIRLKRGHDRPRLIRNTLAGDIDWRNASDHAVFRKQGVPYLYLGGDLHDFYHTSKDTFDNIDQNAFVAAVRAALMLVILLDGLSPQHF